MLYACSERAHLMNAAPFMTRPIGTIIPVYKWWELPYMWAGTKAYEFLAGMSPCACLLVKHISEWQARRSIEFRIARCAYRNRLLTPSTSVGVAD